MDIPFNSEQLVVYQILSSGLKPVPVICLKELESLINQGQQLWIDVVAQDSPDLISGVCGLLKIHNMVIDDIKHLAQQRPKTQILDHYLFWIIRLYSVAADSQFLLKKMASILKDNVLITFRNDRDDVEQSSLKLIDDYLSTVEEPKADYLAVLLIHLIMEEAYQSLDNITEHLEKIEETVIDSPKKIKLSEVYLIKRRILILRKLIEPIIDLSGLITSEKQLIKNSLAQTFLRKIRNNSLRALDILDFYQQMISYIFDMYLSSTNALTNKSISLLTQFSTVFIPISFITGVYGMNFKYMPELAMKYAYPVVWGVMIAIAGCMFYFFKNHQDY
jgi:magnesium transporter